MSRLQQLAERRAMLVERLAYERLELGRQFRELEQRSDYVNRGYSIAQTVRSHPKLAAASGVAAMYLLKRFFPGAAVAGTALTTFGTGFSYLKNRWFSRKRENP